MSKAYEEVMSFINYSHPSVIVDGVCIFIGIILALVIYIVVHKSG